MTRPDDRAPPAPPLAYETALQLLLQDLRPVAAKGLPRDQALGRVAAEWSAIDSPAPGPLPAQARALCDGWACRALDLVGASALSPVPLPVPPQRVEAGDWLAPGCDTVLPDDLVTRQGPLWLALGEQPPGMGALRPGAWQGQDGGGLARPGTRIGLADLALAEAAGLDLLPVRLPHIALIDSRLPDTGQSPPSLAQAGPTSRALAGWLGRMGSAPRLWGAPGRSAAALAQTLDNVARSAPDLIMLIGGTGQAPGDAAGAALAQAGHLWAGGLGLSAAPGTRLAWIGTCPALALPGLPEPAFAAAIALVLPCLQRLMASAPTPPLTLPLLRKITAQVGQAELALLQRHPQGWLPLAPSAGGQPVSLPALARADAWAVVPSGDEGYAPGTMLTAWPMEGWR